MTPPSVAPPPPQFIPVGYPPGGQPRVMPPPKKKSSSGCGCLLAILIVVGIFVAIGRYSAHSIKPYNAPKPSEITVELAGSATLPQRPQYMFTPPPLPLGPSRSPVLRNLSIQRVWMDGAEHYVLKANVGMGSQPRVLVAAYFLNSQGYPVQSQGYGYAHVDGTACIGSWVSDSTSRDPYGSTPTTLVEMSMPTSVAPNTATVQFSLFGEDYVELARGSVAVPGGAARSYPNYSPPAKR